MANTLIAKRSSVAGKQPLATDLQVGEIAVNLADRLIFTKNTAGSVIQIGGSTSGSNPVVINLTGNGSTTAFALGATPPSANAVSVYIGGAYQFKNTYTITGSTITFSEAPPNGVPIEVVWGSTLDINVPTDGVVTQAKLASNVAGTGPAFRAYRSGSDQALSANVWTKVQLNTEDFDTNNFFDSTTNYRFQPTIAGYYHIDFAFQVLGSSIVAISIYKNGSHYGIGCYYETALPNTGLNTQDLVYMNGTTDYVEGYIIAISSGIVVNGTIANRAQTRMSGYLVRAA